MTQEKEPFRVPDELKEFDKYTNYRGRAEELINSNADAFSNPMVAIMRAEIGAQYTLLHRLQEAGLLRSKLNRKQMAEATPATIHQYLVYLFGEENVLALYQLVGQEAIAESYRSARLVRTDAEQNGPYPTKLPLVPKAGGQP